MSAPRRLPRATAPSGASPRERLRLPAAVDILGQVWSVEACPSWSDSGVVGDCSARERRIRIDERLSPDVAMEVFFHELLHAMLAASGAGYGIDSETEERVVYALAPTILDTFKRNRFRFA